MKEVCILILVCLVTIVATALLVGGEVRVPARSDDISVTWGMFK